MYLVRIVTTTANIPPQSIVPIKKRSSNGRGRLFKMGPRKYATVNIPRKARSIVACAKYLD